MDAAKVHPATAVIHAMMSTMRHLSTGILALALAAPAQGAVLSVERLWGGSGNDGFRDLALAPDGTLFAVGMRANETGGDFDAWVVRLDAGGNLLCEETIAGSGDDAALAVAVDGNGVAYVAGTTSSPDLNTYGYPAETTLVQGEMGSDPETLAPSESDAFLARLNDQCEIQFLTYLGGAGRDSGRDVALFDDPAGTRIYLLGSTDSPGLALEGAYQREPGGAGDLFVARFNEGGQRLYLTYLGGSGADWGAALAVDAAGGDVAVVGFSASDGLATPGSWDEVRQGGTCVFDRTDPLAQGHPCYDGLVARFDPTLATVRFVTYLGGREDEYPTDLAFDAAGDLILTGSTLSPAAVVSDPGATPDPFPLSELPEGGAGDSESLDAFVLALAGDGGALRWSRLLRGSDNEFYNALALGPGGEIYLAGHAWSEDLAWRSPLQTLVLGGEARVTALDGDGQVVFDSLLGGIDSDFLYAVRGDGSGRLWLAGGSWSPAPGGVAGDVAQGGSDAWLARLDVNDTRTADLALTGEFEGAGRVDQPLALRLSVDNRGTVDAPAVRLLATLPSAARVQAPDGCEVRQARLLCDLGDLPAGQAVERRLELVPLRGGPLHVQAGLAAAVSEASPADARLHLSTEVEAPPPAAALHPALLVALAALWRRRVKGGRSRAERA